MGRAVLKAVGDDSRSLLELFNSEIVLSLATQLFVSPFSCKESGMVHFGNDGTSSLMLFQLFKINCKLVAGFPTFPDC